MSLLDGIMFPFLDRIIVADVDSTPRYSQILSDTVRYCQIALDTLSDTRAYTYLQTCFGKLPSSQKVSGIC